MANVNSYLNVLAEAKEYRTLAGEADKMIKAKPDLWWLYQYRAIARRQGANDRAGALADLSAGLAIARKNNDANAITSLVRSMAVQVGVPEVKKVLEPMAERDAHWQLLLAHIMQETGDRAGALVAVEKALASPTLPPRDLEQALKMSGYLNMTSSPPNVAKSIEAYKRLLKEIPNEPTALNNLAYLLVDEQSQSTYSPSEAVQYSQRVYDQAQRDGVKDEMAYIMDTHGWALVLSGRVDEGIALLRKAIEKKSIPDTHYHLGMAFLKKDPPMLVDAERSLLDAQQAIRDVERSGKPVDEVLKAKVENGLAEVKKRK
jgi:tetratricopeptide (TPR) repeat protein